MLAYNVKVKLSEATEEARVILPVIKISFGRGGRKERQKLNGMRKTLLGPITCTDTALGAISLHKQVIPLLSCTH